MNYEAVIGLEVHVQVKTRSKMFSRSAAGYGEPENTLTDPVVLALPGALPVMNKAALDQVIKAGLMLGCEIAPVCKWDRKNYFYPDSPKNYQISQYDQPICRGGSVEIELPGPARNLMGEHKRIPLTRIHLEEDVGKLTHAAGGSLVDYNRAGTPLMEIVSEPALRGADEAFAYLTALRTVMIYAGISDCDMEKGQLRCDANVSIRPAGGAELGTKVELKNLNSISFVRDGIAHEIRRQLAVVAAGGAVVQETRDYDGQTGASQSLRTKEMAHDYRYFPDPDLMPVVVDDAWKASLAVPELPFDRQRRFFEQYKVPYTTTSVLVADRELSDYFEETVKLTGLHLAQTVGNWIINDLLRELRNGQARWHLKMHVYSELQKVQLTYPHNSSIPSAQPPTHPGPEPSLANIGLTPERLADLIKRVESGAITNAAAKGIFVKMFHDDQTAADAIAQLGLDVAIKPGDLERWCRDAIAANPKSLADFKSGKDSAINGFKGSVMRAAKGKADPSLVDATLRRLLARG